MLAFRDDMLPQPLYGIPEYPYRETTPIWKIGIRIVLFIAAIVSCIIGVVIIAKKSKKLAIIISIIILIILSIILFLFGELIFDI